MKARVHVTLKNGVLDPQGKAIGHSLNRLGFAEVSDVRQGKFIELELAETDKVKAKERLETNQPHPEERAQRASRRMGNRQGARSHPSRRAPTERSSG
jgi:phosphoribosylformylglycinamidine synthase subunit PurS